ncbi:5-formyltetrahydrofolate cyclo-ligase [Williamsia maris]|nr:5-formyltetrahydrofolate cyclo-ligase [Williamsia maris]
MNESSEDSVAGEKAALRHRLIAARAAMDATERATAAEDLAGWMSVDVPFRLEADVTVCCYASVGTEPGTAQMLDALVDRGVTVLLPITPDGPPTALEWARYTGRHGLRTGRFSLSEPTGRRLSNAALDTADVALIPALAVDRRGVRLGRGAGYYDRSLVATGAELVAVVYDDEVLDDIPADEYDIAVSWALTPGDGFTRLG